jgi:ketosteroid isomerase-like protein
MGTDADKTEIRAIIETIHKAYHDKNAAAIVAQYARDAVIFDLAPPLSHTGKDLPELEAWLDKWRGPVERETRDLVISVSGDLAFGHGFFRVSATTKTGEQAAWWMRVTVCLVRQQGAWKIAHEHESVPFYMDGSFRAAVDLEP